MLTEQDMLERIKNLEAVILVVSPYVCELKLRGFTGLERENEGDDIDAIHQLIHAYEKKYIPLETKEAMVRRIFK